MLNDLLNCDNNPYRKDFTAAATVQFKIKEMVSKRIADRDINLLQGAISQEWSGPPNVKFHYEIEHDQLCYS